MGLPSRDHFSSSLQHAPLERPTHKKGALSYSDGNGLDSFKGTSYDPLNNHACIQRPRQKHHARSVSDLIESKKLRVVKNVDIPIPPSCDFKPLVNWLYRIISREKQSKSIQEYMEILAQHMLSEIFAAFCEVHPATKFQSSGKQMEIKVVLRRAIIDRRLRGLEKIVWWCKFLLSLSQCLDRIAVSSRGEDGLFHLPLVHRKSYSARPTYDPRPIRVRGLIQDSGHLHACRGEYHPRKFGPRNQLSPSPLRKATNVLTNPANS